MLQAQTPHHDGAARQVAGSLAIHALKCKAVMKRQSEQKSGKGKIEITAVPLLDVGELEA